jgi:NDP-sugar pyrophosphorylase family protein
VTGGVRAFLFAAGRGVRFRPVTDRIPKPLFPYLNVPLAAAHLARLRDFGVAEAAVNLHHLGEQIEKHLVDRASELPKLRFFPESQLLGTAGGLKNAASFLASAPGHFLVVNADAAIEPDFGALLERHRASGRLATLLVVENQEPDRYTPLQSEGDRITAFGRQHGERPIDRPLLYTGVCVLDASVLEMVPAGETSLVEHVWKPMLERKEQIGFVLHKGPFADLGRPGDFLRASLEALARGGPFPRGSGTFEDGPRVLAIRPEPLRTSHVVRCVLGDATVGAKAFLEDSVVWSGTAVGGGATLERCLLAGGVVPEGAVFRDAILWGQSGQVAEQFPLGAGAHGFHPGSPRR